MLAVTIDCSGLYKESQEMTTGLRTTEFALGKTDSAKRSLAVCNLTPTSESHTVLELH